MDPLPLRESPAIFLLRWGYFRGQVIYVRSDNAAHGHLGAVSQNHHPDTPPPSRGSLHQLAVACSLWAWVAKPAWAGGHLELIPPPCHILGPLHASVLDPCGPSEPFPQQQRGWRWRGAGRRGWASRPPPAPSPKPTALEPWRQNLGVSGLSQQRDAPLRLPRQPRGEVFKIQAR